MKNLINFFNIIGNKYIFFLFFLVLVLFFNSLLEMLFIAILYPFVSLLISEGTNIVGSDDNKFLYLLNYFTESPNQIQNLLYLTTLVFALKFLFNIITLFFSSKFAYSLLQNLSYKLFSSYLSRNYIDLSKENSSFLIRNLTLNLNTFVNGVSASISLLSEILITLSITVLLLLIDLKITGTILISFIIFCAIFLFLTKFQINKLAKQRFIFEGKKIKKINEDLGGLIDIKLSGNISYFKQEYFILENLIKKNYINLQVLLGLPKIWIEFLTISLFLLFTHLLINYSNLLLLNYVPLIGIYALSAFKLMPSFNRILINYNTLKFTKKVFSNMYNELKKLKFKNNKKSQSRINECNKFELKNVKFYYDKKKMIINKMNYKFAKGKTYGIYGTSGKGKSTLINLILGLLRPVNGQINYNNKKNIFKNLSVWQESISYVPQKPFFFDNTIAANIAIGLNKEKINFKKINDCLEIVNLKNKIDNLKKKHNASIGEIGKKFSGGELQRIAIARAIYKDGQMMILDEATSALDSKNEKNIINRIKKKFNNKIVIIISHKQKLINSCDYKIKL